MNEEDGGGDGCDLNGIDDLSKAFHPDAVFPIRSCLVVCFLLVSSAPCRVMDPEFDQAPNDFAIACWDTLYGYETAAKRQIASHNETPATSVVHCIGSSQNRLFRWPYNKSH